MVADRQPILVLWVNGNPIGNTKTSGNYRALFYHFICVSQYNFVASNVVSIIVAYTKSGESVDPVLWLRWNRGDSILVFLITLQRQHGL